MTYVKGLVVAITGAGSGLGLGLVEYMVEQGAKVAALEISTGKADALRQRFGDGVLVQTGDVRRLQDLVSFRDAIVDRFGGVDAVLGVQGIFDDNRPLKDIPSEQLGASFDEIMQVNVLGYIYTAKVFGDALAARKGSLVLTASSCASYCADGGAVLYTASKHAVMGVIRQLAYELAPAVRVNGVAPCGIANSHLSGPQAMGLQNKSQNDIPKDAFMEMIRKVTLLGVLPEGREYGPIYALLASPAGSTMTGEIIMADQGLANRPIINAR